MMNVRLAPLLPAQGELLHASLPTPIRTWKNRGWSMETGSITQTMMSNGFLKLEGGPPLAGMVEDVHDRMLFRTRTDMTETEFARFFEGEIERNGVTEQVTLERADPSADGNYSMDLTLRRLLSEPGQ